MERPQSLESEQSSKSSSETTRALEFHFLTLFPEIFPSVLGSSLLGKAQEKGLVSYKTVQIRDFAEDKHRTTDDVPYGGGEGMVLKADVLYRAWESTGISGQQEESPKSAATLILSPQGRPFTQSMAHELASYSKLVLVCGHYEGIDERFIQVTNGIEVSIGDYVLTGGELPAMVLADCITRLVPGVVGNERSLSEESLERGLLKYPQFTRPRSFQGLEVPEILLSGNHQKIKAWRAEQMRIRTREKRPDLWARAQLEPQLVP